MNQDNQTPKATAGAKKPFPANYKDSVNEDFAASVESLFGTLTKPPSPQKPTPIEGLHWPDVWVGPSRKSHPDLNHTSGSKNKTNRS